MSCGSSSRTINATPNDDRPVVEPRRRCCPAARRVVRLHWSKRLETLPIEPVDAKSALQEWAQGQGFDLPKYKELSREGPDHAPHFTTEVRVGGRKAPLARTAQGEGASKRSAEQSAATALLIKEGVWKATI